MSWLKTVEVTSIGNTGVWYIDHKAKERQWMPFISMDKKDIEMLLEQKKKGDTILHKKKSRQLKKIKAQNVPKTVKYFFEEEEVEKWERDRVKAKREWEEEQKEESK